MNPNTLDHPAQNQALNQGKARFYAKEIQQKLATIIPPGYTQEQELGCGNSSMAWIVTDSGKNRRVLKVTAPGESNESHNHALFARFAHNIGIPVGQILQVGDGWCLEEMVPGRKLLPQEPLHEKICDELGGYIGLLHGTDDDSINQLKQDGARDFDIMRDEIDRSERCHDAVKTRIGALNLKRIWEYIHKLMPDKRHLSKHVPCHSDITYDNLFVNELGNITGIIDFGSAVLGPRELEFSSIMRMEIMNALDFRYYQLTKASYEACTGTKLNESLIQGLVLLKCLRKISKWQNSPKRMIQGLTYIMGENFRAEEINPKWGKEIM